MAGERKWESIIPFEDRANGYTTSRWRLLGISTHVDHPNTDAGVLWLQMTKSGDTVTANLYKDDGLASGDKVATGTADVSSIDATAANAAELTLTASESSGITGSFWIHNWEGDGDYPVQIALCTDEDIDQLYSAMADLDDFSHERGCADFIRFAQEDILGKVTALFRAQLGGFGAEEAWFITDATRSAPDLRRIANPGQLKIACAHHALEKMLGREHQRSESTMYSELRDWHKAEYESAMSALALTFKAGGGDNASADQHVAVVHQERG